MVKRINTWQDALATGKAVLDVGDGIEIPLPTSGNFGGAAGPPGAGVPTGGSALQVIRKNEAGTTTEWVTPDKTMVGLSNVNNTADADKPVSTPQAAALQARVKDGALSSGTTDYVFVRDTSDASASTFRYEDDAAHLGSILNIHHKGQGAGGFQAYGINIANHPGAKAAFVIHQYSSAGAMIRLDNTDVYSAIQIWNTENQTMNPGNTGTGAFLDFKPWGEVERLRLLDDLTWINETAKNFTFQSATASNYGLGVKVTKDIPALFVHKNSTGAGAGVSVTNEGTSPSIDITQNGNGLGLRVTTGASVAGYAAQVKGQSYGAAFETVASVSNTQALLVHKKGTGVGEGVRIINAGTGATVSYRNAALTETARITAEGEYENLTVGKGILVKSPNGTRYRLSVSDAGAVTAVVA